jgi:signal transduction histidine kinase/FixJ family two-component response regulator
MTAEAGREPSIQQQIEAEQIDILFRQAPLVQGVTIFMASCLAWFMLGIAPRATVLAWWAAVVVLAIFRIGLVAAYLRWKDTRFQWQHAMTLAAVISGLVWGAAGWMFYLPESQAGLMFVTIMLAGMAAGSAVSQSSWLPAQFAYAVPTLTPIALRYLLEGGELWLVGLMSLVFLAAMLGFSRRLCRTLVSAIRLRIEKQALVRQLNDEKQRAEEANAAKSKFLAAASHDLRQPLHAMNLFVEALRRERDPIKAADVVAHLGASAQALEELLNELLDISKLEAGMFQPQVGVIDLQKLFDALAREFVPVAEDKGIELGFVATRTMVRSDPHMLGRILRNIVANAVRYTVKGAVLVGCRRKGGAVAVAVYDTGPGIAPEHHEAIFREFYQLGNPERDRRKGLGLGLAIVDGLCRVLGHRLTLKSRPGRGSAFLVQMPTASADEVPEQVPAPETVDIAGWQVLVIDDEPAICQAMADVLSSWGCGVLTAESGEEAVAHLAARGFAPDVIVADYRLREGCTGADAIAKVRRHLGRAVPAAILTGDTAPERLREATASGYVLLHKPVKPHRLRVALIRCREAGCSDNAVTQEEDAAVSASPALAAR